MIEVARIYRVENGSSLKAFVDVSVNGQVLIKGVKVFKDRDGNESVSMPKQQAKNGKWYLDLAPNEYGEWQDADTYGPFPSEKAADKYLDRFSNPGSLDIDDSGDRPVPKKSPNGSRIQKPGSRMWESARPQIRAMKHELQDMFKPDDSDKVIALYLKHRNSVDKFVDAAVRAKIDTREHRRTYEQEWHDIWFALRAVE